MFMLTLLCLWAAADLGIKLYYNRQLATFRRSLLSFATAAQTKQCSECSAAAQQCLDCKRLRGHDDDCELDMSVLPPRSDCGGDVR